jgi:hypothetical protein
VINFYQQRPVFAFKIYPRPQRPKKASKVQNIETVDIGKIIKMESLHASQKGLLVIFFD